MKKQYVTATNWFLIICFLLLFAGPVLAGSCSLFEESFSTGAETNWLLDDDWNLQDGSLEVTTSSADSSSSALYLQDFNPGQPFSLDVDFSAANVTGSGEYCSLYVYAMASTFDPENSYLVDGVKTDGMEIIIHPLEQTMEFQYWDVVNWTWKNTTPASIPWPLSSFGLSFTDSAVIFRANGKDTSLKISGSFNPAHPPLDSISLKAEGHGASFTFSHLCAVPYDAGSGGDDIPPASDDYPNAAPFMSMLAVGFGGGSLVNPADTPVAVPAVPLLIQPTMAIPTADRGQTANLFAYIYLPQVKTGFTFSAPQPVTLGDETTFSAVFPDVIDMTGQDGFIFDVYYGYSLADGSIHYNAYEVTLGSSAGNGSGLKKTRTVGLGSDVAGFLDPSILEVLSNAGESALSGSGSGTIDFVHDDENVPNPTLLMITNDAGNPILLKMSDDPGDDFTAETTALALVLYDPNILLLPHQDFLRVRTAVRADSRLATLAADIKSLIQAHDPNPLDYDSHPELYQQAVTIAKDALEGIATAGSYAAYAGSFQENKQPLEVVDDQEHSTGEVVLTNRTMCYYDITADKDGNPFQTYKIERRNLLDYHIVSWPLKFNPGIDLEATYKAEIGDGNLSFAFEKQKELTVTYCMLSAATTAIGAGSTKLKNIEEGLDAIASSGGEIAALMHKMLSTKPNNQAECNQLAYDLVYGVFHSGYTLVTTIYETQIKEQLQHRWCQTAFRILGSKLLLWGTASYATGDIAVTLWDLHYAPDSYSEEGWQVSGEYPVRLNISSVEPNSGKAGDMITVNFERSTPSAVMPVKLMLGKMEVGTIYDQTQSQILFTVPDEATTGTLKLTYGSAESNGVTFTVGEPAAAHSGSVTGEEHTLWIDNDKSPDGTLEMKVTADWQVNTDGGITVSSRDDFSNTTILFELEAPSWKKPNQGTFTVTLGNSAIKDIEASYSYAYGGWWGNVTFGQPYFTIEKSLTCYDGPADESGLEFSFTQKDNVITGSYLFPKNREGAYIHLRLNIPYTCTRPDDPDTTDIDESCTTTGVCSPHGILLLFRNYNYFNNSHDPCDCK